jgi:6-phosphogluconolactonase
MIRIFGSPNDLARATAQHFVARSVEAVAQRGLFTVALSGGSTPKSLYQILANQFRDQIPWLQTHFFWSDERHVPPDHPDSNYRMANEFML